MSNIVDPDQTAPIGEVCSGSTLFVSIPNSSVMLGNYLQQTTSADNIFRCVFFLGSLRIKLFSCSTLLSMKLQLLIKTKMLKNKDVSSFQTLRCCISLSCL